MTLTRFAFSIGETLIHRKRNNLHSQNRTRLYINGRNEPCPCGARKKYKKYRVR